MAKKNSPSSQCEIYELQASAINDTSLPKTVSQDETSLGVPINITQHAAIPHSTIAQHR